ncbi:MAG: transketolase [Candidatus Eremiobacteraeota bacterium]|nr:transketolase [Candidatus Eremiobacteraeota bacterium]
MFSKAYVEALEQRCSQVRRDLLTMLHEAKSGHSGGSLSSVEVMVALYFYKMKHNPENPGWEGRDYFILSKGHVCPTLYAVMAQAGYLPVEELMTLRKMGSRLQGHPHRFKLPGLETSSGSLGQGLSIANGIALALKHDKKPNRVYCLLGDGEIQEGQVWEAAMTAAHYQLDNVCAIVDYNNLEIDGFVEDVMGIYPIVDKWKAFNWHVQECDGNDMASVMKAFDRAGQFKRKPTVIIAHTTKGKGVSFMENVDLWHGKIPKDDQLDQALAQLEGTCSLYKSWN